jgi:hypothetical protein
MPMDRQQYVVLHALLTEWRDCKAEWREARRVLCEIFAEFIRAERTAAEAAFDSAVAVSADGTKICTADYVVVLHHANAHKDLVFPSSAFRGENKALRDATFCSPGCSRASPAHNELAHATRVFTVKTFLRSVDPELNIIRDHTYERSDYARTVAHARLTHEQEYIRCADGRILFVHPDQCPFPLPGDGVEIAV